MLPLEIWRIVASFLSDVPCLSLVCKNTRDACRTFQNTTNKRSLFEALHDPQNARWVIEYASGLPPDHLAPRVLRLAQQAGGGKTPKERAVLAIKMGLRSKDSPVDTEVLAYAARTHPPDSDCFTKEDAYLAIKAGFAPVVDAYLRHSVSLSEKKFDHRVQRLVDLAEKTARYDRLAIAMSICETSGKDARPCLFAIRIAAWHGRHHMVKALVENYLPPYNPKTGANILHDWIETAIAWADARGHEQIAEYLRAYAELIQ